MSQAFLVALSLFFLFEGIMPLFFPRQWKDILLKIASLTEGQIRFIGLVAILIAVTLFLM
jgi:uncharacterized protein YjeT (DUF2065 family)